MVTIKEDYVSFEVAKLLKEKGFNEPCECAYSEGGQYLLSCYKGIADRKIKNDEALDFSYSSTAPTLQMAMKWLREIHKIGIFPSTYTLTNVGGTEKYHHYGTAIINLATYELMTDDIIPRCFYEEAVEAALKYCLENLI